MSEENQEKLFEMLFLQMVMSLNEAAMIQLGKMVNPASGKTEKNLGQSQGTIDLLRMLKEKTTNNLSEQETQLLDQCIVNLELSFAAEKEQLQSRRKSSQPEPPKNAEVQHVDDISDADKDDDSNGSPGTRPGMNN